MEDYVLVTCSVVNNPPKDYTEIAREFDSNLSVSVDTSAGTHTLLAMTAYSFEALYRIYEFLQHLRENQYLYIRD